MSKYEIQDSLAKNLSFSGICRLQDTVELLDSKQSILKDQVKDVFGCVLANEKAMKKMGDKI